MVLWSILYVPALTLHVGGILGSCRCVGGCVVGIFLLKFSIEGALRHTAVDKLPEAFARTNLLKRTGKEHTVGIFQFQSEVRSPEYALHLVG